MIHPADDPRAGLIRALAETHLDCLGAEHDYRRILQDGHDHMQSRYPARDIEGHAEDLDHWTWHQEAMAGAMERGGLGEVPALPYVPAPPQPSSEASMVGYSANTISDAAKG